MLDVRGLGGCPHASRTLRRPMVRTLHAFYALGLAAGIRRCDAPSCDNRSVWVALYLNARRRTREEGGP